MSKFITTSNLSRLSIALDDRFKASIESELMRAVAEEKRLADNITSVANSKSDKMYYNSNDYDIVTLQVNENLYSETASMAEGLYDVSSLNLVSGLSYPVIYEFTDGSTMEIVHKITPVLLHNKPALASTVQIDDGMGGLVALIDHYKLIYNPETGISFQPDNTVTSIEISKKIPCRLSKITVYKPKVYEVNTSFLENHRFITEEEREFWNNKANKEDLYYDTRVMDSLSLSWNGKITDQETVECDMNGISYTFVKMDNLASYSSALSCKLAIDRMLSNGAMIQMIGSYSLSQEFLNDICCVSSEGYYDIVITLKDSDITLGDNTINFTKGIWFTKIVDPNAEYFKNMYVKKLSLDLLISGELKLIDTKFTANKPGLVTFDENGDAAGEVFNDSTNTATGYYSHAEGIYCAAEESAAHAEGWGAVAKGTASHAEGYYTTANGSYSHVEGYDTIASGEYQHVQGKCNIEDTENKYAHIVGNGTYNERSNAHTLDWDGNAWFAGNVLANNLPYDTRELQEINITFDGNAGDREVVGFYFRGSSSLSANGLLKISNDVYDNIDSVETVNVYSSTSTAMYYYGKDEIMVNDDYILAGSLYKYVVIVKNDGTYDLDPDIEPVTLTRGTYIYYSNNYGLSYMSDVKLIINNNNGELSVLDGKYLVNSPGRYQEGKTVTISTEEGNKKVVCGEKSEIFNAEYNIASGSYSHAEGVLTCSIGNNSHAEGSNTTAIGVSSHAEGTSTKSIGNSSHAEGSATKAKGLASHAEGLYTIASSDYQHVQGKYSIEDTEDKYAHIVGNGSYKGRSNAHTLDWDGNAWFAGKVTMEGVPIDAKDLVNKEYLDNAIKNELYIRPEDFGAVGDGITDDTNAFQAAIDACSTANGAKTIALSQKTYVIGGLNIKRYTRIVGCGWKNSFFKVLPGFDGNLISISEPNANFVQLKDFCILGDKENNTCQRAISFDKANGTAGEADEPGAEDTWGLVENVRIVNMYRNGLVVTSYCRECRFLNMDISNCNGNGVVSVASDNTFMNITSWNNNIGFHELGSSDRWHSCKGFANDENGFHVSNSYGNIFVLCEAQENLKYGFWIDDMSNSSFIGIKADTNGMLNFGKNTWGYGGIVCTNKCDRLIISGTCDDFRKRNGGHGTQEYGLIAWDLKNSSVDLAINNNKADYNISDAILNDNNNSIKINGVSITEKIYDDLTTENKTLPKAINELNDMKVTKEEKELWNSMNALTLNGYSLWVGTTSELENIEEKDPGTLYFEIDDGTGEEVVQVDIVNGVLNLTDDKYQKTNMIDGTEIVFPTVNKFTEIHLYFDADTNINLTIPDCRLRVDPNIEAGKSYEIVATYNTMRWLVNIIVYS